MVPMLRMEMAWIVRQRGDRYIVTLGSAGSWWPIARRRFFSSKRPARLAGGRLDLCGDGQAAGGAGSGTVVGALLAQRRSSAFDAAG